MGTTKDLRRGQRWRRTGLSYLDERAFRKLLKEVFATSVAGLNMAGLSRLRLALAAVGALTVLNACPPSPPPDAVFVHAAPPPAPTPVPSSLQNIAEADTDRRAWIGGFYRWNGSEYVWVPGRWEKPPHAGAVWVNGLWAHNRSGWYWVEGYWR